MDERTCWCCWRADEWKLSCSLLSSQQPVLSLQHTYTHTLRRRHQQRFVSTYYHCTHVSYRSHAHFPLSYSTAHCIAHIRPTCSASLVSSYRPSPSFE